MWMVDNGFCNAYIYTGQFQKWPEKLRTSSPELSMVGSGETAGSVQQRIVANLGLCHGQDLPSGYD
jgi:hypothetical protein